MKNADRPIYPVLLRQISDNDFKIASEKDSREGIYLSSSMGLTKREHIAAMALQGLLSNTAISGSHDTFAKAAVIKADALLKELES